MFAALCFLIPPLIIILIRCWITPEKEKFHQIVIQFIVSAVVINALTLLISFALFADGKQPIYSLNNVRSFDLKYLLVALAVGVVTLIIEKIIRAHSVRNAIKALIFVLISAAAFVLVGFVAQPIWEDYNYNPTYGFYEVEDNTIETLFLGSSHVRHGVSPMLLYEEYGISSYDLSTDNQPVTASYYWLEEAWRLHSETLDTVVLDTDMLLQSPTAVYFHKAIDPMRFSMVKVRAARAYSEDFSGFLTNLFPLLAYHDRWEEITSEDFLKFNKDSLAYLRGNVFVSTQWVDSAEDASTIATPLLFADEDEEPIATDDFAVDYLQRMVLFCEEHEISLVLITLPEGWTSGQHNTIQMLADEYGLDYLDFNLEPYFSATEFDMATDFMTPTQDEADFGNLHANYYGSEKLTDYLGSYLIEECGNRDVRGEEMYAFMEDELGDYSRYTIEIELGEIEDPKDYFAYFLDEEDYELFLSVNGDAAGALTEEQREYFASIGLTELADIGYQDSYVAVLDDGDVLTEERIASDETAGIKGTDETWEERQTLTAEGTMEDGKSYILKSCGGSGSDGAVSSCEIDGKGHSWNKRGLNIVVYDKKLHCVVDASVFNTSASATRKPVYVLAALEQDLEDGVPYEDFSSAEQTLYEYLMR